MHMSFSVAVAGCTGYAGGEILRLLLGHPKVTIGSLTAGRSAGSRFGDHQPHLAGLRDRMVQETTAENLKGHDVVFLALPHGASAEVAKQLDDDTLIVDCGADFRLKSADRWEKFYHSEHAGTWPYGLPEMPGHREALKNTKRIAVPGCYVTTVTLGLMPLVLDGLITGQDITIAAASGTSGAGKSLKPHLLAAEVAGGMSVYSVAGIHRHIPEIQQNLEEFGAINPTISFTPMLAPMPRGIIAVMTAPIADTVTDEQVRDGFENHYDDEPFVHFLPEGKWPVSKWIVGSNGCLVQATIDREAGRVLVVSTLDNLTKGTAGGAIQAMNIALGLDETTGLNSIGVAP